jgi:hypothetical protein
LMVLLTIVVIFLLYLLVGFGCGLPGEQHLCGIFWTQLLTRIQLGVVVSGEDSVR